VQSLRKRADLALTDRIEVGVAVEGGDPAWAEELSRAIGEHGAAIKAEVLATEMAFEPLEDPDTTAPLVHDGGIATVSIRRSR
jgi:hypothetical protein